MKPWHKILVSSFLNTVVTTGTGLLAVLADVSSMSEVGSVQWTIIAVGAVIAFAKDIMAYMGDPKPLI